MWLFWSKGVVRLKYFHINTYQAKYIKILESSFDKKLISRTTGLYIEIMIQNTNKILSIILY